MRLFTDANVYASRFVNPPLPMDHPAAEAPPSTPAPAKGPSARQSARRIFRNAGALVSGKAAGGVLSLAYLAIAARTLGPADMGFLVLAHAYAMIIAGVARFQSWQAVIRFGAPMIAGEETDRFRTLVRYAIKLDLLSAAAAIVLALALVRPAAAFFDWPDDAMPYVYVYCFATPFLISATPTGVLRLFDRFRLLGWQQVLMPSVRFVGALALWIAGGGLEGFLAVWVAGVVLDGASFWLLGWRELAARGLLPALRPAPGERADAAWLPFMVKTNIVSTIELARSHLPLALTGGILGSAASGFLQIAINLSNLIAHPTNMLNHATFPELSKIAAAQGARAMRKVAQRSVFIAAAIAAPFALAYCFFGEPLARLVGGPAFAPAGLLVGLMGLAQLLRIASVVLESGVMALGRAGYALAAQAASASLTILLLILTLPAVGPAGAPTAIMAGWAVLVAAYAAALRRAG